jgi:hypothetical protein
MSKRRVFLGNAFSPQDFVGLTARLLRKHKAVGFSPNGLGVNEKAWMFKQVRRSLTAYGRNFVFRNNVCSVASFSGFLNGSRKIFWNRGKESNFDSLLRQHIFKFVVSHSSSSNRIAFSKQLHAELVAVQYRLESFDELQKRVRGLKADDFSSHSGVNKENLDYFVANAADAYGHIGNEFINLKGVLPLLIAETKHVVEGFESLAGK